MGFLSWILFGFVAGAIARLAVRGGRPIGCLATIGVGIAGALIGGVMGQVVLGHKVHFHWGLGPFLLAVAGSIVLLLLLEGIGSRRRRL